VRTPEGYWGKPWSPEELAYLRENYTLVPAKDIAAHLGRSLNGIYQRANTEGLKSRHRMGVNSLVKDYFHAIDTPRKAWVLGLLAADGSISKTGQLKLELHEKDLEIVETVRSELAPDARISFYNTRTTPMARFMVADPQLISDLANHGVVNKKSLITRWPAELPARLENSYVCGYFDGDGSLGTKPTLRWAITSGTLTFLYALQEHIHAHTGLTVGGPYADKRHNSAWSIVSTGESVRVLDEWIHKDVPGLTRKRLA
jgi:hypothetical protein